MGTISWKSVTEIHILHFYTLPLYIFWNPLHVKYFPPHTPKVLSLTLFYLICICRVEQCIGVSLQRTPVKWNPGSPFSLFHLSYQRTGHRWISGTLITIPKHFHPKLSHKLWTCSNQEIKWTEDKRYCCLKNGKNVTFHF